MVGRFFFIAFFISILCYSQDKVNNIEDVKNSIYKKIIYDFKAISNDSLVVNIETEERIPRIVGIGIITKIKYDSIKEFNRPITLNLNNVRILSDSEYSYLSILENDFTFFKSLHYLDIKPSIDKWFYLNTIFIEGQNEKNENVEIFVPITYQIINMYNGGEIVKKQGYIYKFIFHNNEVKFVERSKF